MGHLYRSWRSHHGTDRSSLPSYERWEVADVTQDGRFTVGRAVGMVGFLRWSPLDGEPPHALVSGSTGGGKTSLMATWACLPMLWNQHHGSDWAPTMILDPKGGQGYEAAIALGAQVVTEADDIREALAWAYKESERRNRLMGQLTIEQAGHDGIMREVRPKTFRDLTPEQRAAHGMQPMVLLIDEAADLLGKKEEGAPVKAVWGAARQHVKELAQKARAAGIILILGIVRPDAAILEGFTRAQLQARVAVGDMDPEGWKMVLGPTDGKTAEEERESMAPGQGWATGIGGKTATRVYVGHVDLITSYVPEAIDPSLPVEERAEIIARRAERLLQGDAPIEDEVLPDDMTGASQDVILRAAWAWLEHHGPATRREVADAIHANHKTVEAHILTRRTGEPGTGHFRIVGKKGQTYLWEAAGTQPRKFTPRRGGSRGVRGVEGDDEWGRWLGVAQDVRAVATGWLVRMWLRVFTLRLVIGPTKEGPIYRDPRVVWAAHDASSGRCDACGRGGQLNAHHVRSLWAGGADSLSNVRMLCQRVGAASCHGAVTEMERRVRDVRKRIGTYDDGLGAPTPLSRVAWRLVKLRSWWWWGLFAAPVVGFVHHPGRWQIAAAATFVVLGPVWAWFAARGSRLDLLPSPDNVVDPKQRRGSFVEWLKAKGGKGFLARMTLKKHNRSTKRVTARHYTLRVTGLYLTGAHVVFLVFTVVPAVLVGVVSYFR